MKRTKIVCTLGPSSWDPLVLEKMIRAGMNVARINFSHGSYSDHARIIRTIRSVAKKCGQDILILQDLQGPRIRLGDLPSEGVSVSKGDRVVFVGESLFAGNYSGKNKDCIIPMQYEKLYQDLKPRDMILVEDGTKRFVVEKSTASGIITKVVVGGVLKTHKGMNMPGVDLGVDVITKKDKADLEFGLKMEVDFVALSFVRDARDIHRLESLIRACDSKANPGIIAKIEREEAIANLDEIIKAASGIMVARGDLGIELAAERVPLLQKEIIHRCRFYAKPVIVATQMLDSMIANPQPTRAEVSDVANAVIDRSDAVMLSGESAAGKYPVEAVEMMARIIHETESSEEDNAGCGELGDPRLWDEFLAWSAFHAFSWHLVDAIVVFDDTESGYRAGWVARYRPRVPILVFSRDKLLGRQSLLFRGVQSYSYRWDSWEECLSKASGMISKEGILPKGSTILCLGSEQHPGLKSGFMDRMQWVKL
ncbi:MAG: pyruvate kinase [Parcubacteria group bacterium Gr01-1014_18]|nr:MAG: pyruvate kinase [Parcubacteria group bacterium Greene0416_36]TSC81348.1 MAG: pyruvate kinase [Parcubacteria group bacterium Gr01-1014_18]TSC99466.1 MAG: pyruvate kinase [Parcubacteria group bacterium Greene1014_20]TSD07615.1 MAG: pyruvate kinase [Parcubacteria group bacterium Greene0714_2]